MRHPAYEHSQITWTAWLLLPVTATIALIESNLHRPHHGPLATAIIIGAHLLVLLVFGRFTVQVDSDTLEWKFGVFGLPRWRLPMAEIAAVEVARTCWADGWGIRRTRQGMLYNASGFGAVRVRRRDGRSLRLGSDEPARLAAFIARRLPPR